MHTDGQMDGNVKASRRFLPLLESCQINSVIKTYLPIVCNYIKI
jgi:hypothetical protein